MSAYKAKLITYVLYDSKTVACCKQNIAKSTPLLRRLLMNFFVFNGLTHFAFKRRIDSCNILFRMMLSSFWRAKR